jgi:hypothetical protein
MHDDRLVRTTLDIDDDVLQSAKELAGRGRTMGQVLSDLARKALETKTSYTTRNGVPVIPHRPGAPLITNADVRRWLDEDE